MTTTRSPGQSLTSRGRYILVLIALLASCQSDVNDAIIASGYIEGKEIVIAPEVSGRIALMYVERGDRVQAGDVLLQLDDDVLQSHRLEAEAGLASATANLDHVLAGARREEIAAAEAALAQAEANRDGAAQAVAAASKEIDDPQALNTDIKAAQAAIALAEQRLELASANLAETEMQHNYYAAQGGDVERTWNLLYRAAEAERVAAQAELDGARRSLELLQVTRDDPLALHAQLHTAETQYHVAQAQVAIAQARLARLQTGPTEQEVAMAEAQARQAAAAVQLADARIAQLTLTAPMSGVVATRSGHAGETATAGAPLLTIANLDKVNLVIYIAETRIGHVRVGQEVEVRVDSFPERTFLGHVASIANEAEFTPRNVQTQEERVNLVFAVTVHIPNPQGELKPGMPADATLRP